jgi:cytochrome c peroxidase
MKEKFKTLIIVGISIFLVIFIISNISFAQLAPMSSYQFPLSFTEPFAKRMAKEKAEKAKFIKRQMDLLDERYDLSNQPAKELTMSGGKPIQEGIRVKLPKGMTWEKLATMSPQEIKEKDLFPRGFMPLPHPYHEHGGQVFPKFHIDEVIKQEGRDLTRFDVDFDIPDHFLPEFPPSIYLTTRTDLGDVSQGKLVTIMNYYEVFNGILTPKQLEGLRLLVTPFPQQEFNQTNDRKTELPSRGVSCFECHANGHTNGATHLVQDIRPNEARRRLDTPTLRGVNIQRLFGSQRALKSVEDFTEFEQRGAYFDGDPVLGTKKGINILERGSQVHFMAEFQEMLNFPPAPKLNIYGMLDPKDASEPEMHGQAIFFGRAKCAICHPAPYYTDNLMHDLRAERFYEARMVNGKLSVADGPIKTFPLRGIKDSPPYLHDGRLLTLEDTVEFFNIIQQLNLTEQEKKDLVAFMMAL